MAVGMQLFTPKDSFQVYLPLEKQCYGALFMSNSKRLEKSPGLAHKGVLNSVAVRQVTVERFQSRTGSFCKIQSKKKARTYIDRHKKFESQKNAYILSYSKVHSTVDWLLYNQTVLKT